MSWVSDFAWRDGRLWIRKTNIGLRFDRKVIAEIARWLPWLALLGGRAAWARLMRRRPLRIWYAPDVPRPWYMMRAAALWAGASVARSPEEADLHAYFDDVTQAHSANGACDGLNGRCTDVSKGHVGRIFEEVFGYPLLVDPEAHDGPVVEKSEKNGVHDGRILPKGAAPRPDCVYQRLVDTTDDQGSARDLRTLCVGGAPLLVWVKQKPAGARFAIHNRRADLCEPSDVFSPDEIVRIRQFAGRMGLDWGGMDVLRDRHDGRLYIVDVNKTDVGPVIALSWADKMRSLDRLARALDALAQSRGVASSVPAVGVPAHAI